MRRLRILRAITRMNVGGPALHVSLLTARLDADRFETLLVAGREGPREGDMVELGRVTGVEIRRVATLVRSVAPISDLRALLEVGKIARAYRPDVVHTHMAKAGFVGRIVARLLGVAAVIHTYHGSVFHAYFGRRETGLYLNIERALSRVTTRIVAITARQRAELIALGVGTPAKIVEIPLGLELRPFLTPPGQEDARRALGLPSGVPLVGIVARLTPIKDVGTFLRAMSLVPEPARAVVVGDGDERPMLEALAARLGIARRCHFIGWQADMLAVYGAIDVLALSSLNEGSPVSVIEGMAAGKAVVATAVGGVPDVIADDGTGLLVPARDEARLAAAVNALVGDPSLRHRLGQAARTAVYPRYDVSRLIDDVSRLYFDLVR